MNLGGPAFALLSAATWGAGDFFGGLASRFGGLRPALVLTQLFGVLLALALLPFANEAPPPPAAFAWAAAAGVAGVAGVGCLYLALAAGTMGLVAPLTGLIAAAIPALVGVARGEPVGPVLLAGMVTALAAVVVISLPDRAAGPARAAPRAAATAGARAREWALILGAGLGFAGFYLLVDVAHGAGAGTAYTLVGVRLASTAVAAVLLVVPVVAGRPSGFPVSRRVVGLALLTGLGDTGGNVFFIIASGVGALSVTVVLASLYPVSTALLARIVLRERLSRVRIAGVALAVAGAVLISAGSAGA